MKHLLLSLLIFPVLASLTNCASMRASSTEPLLSAAGFRIHAPKNGEQQKLYDALPPYKVHRGTYEGEIFYAYKNEKEGVAYIGNETAYQKYQSLAVQKSIASSNYNAAMMNEMTATRWYRGYYRPYWY